MEDLQWNTVVRAYVCSQTNEEPWEEQKPPTRRYGCVSRTPDLNDPQKDQACKRRDQGPQGPGPEDNQAGQSAEKGHHKSKYRVSPGQGPEHEQAEGQDPKE